MTSPATERRRGRGWLIASLAVVGVIAIAGVFVLVAVVTRPSATPTPTPAPTSTSSVTANRTTQGACGPVAYDKTNTLTAAPQTTWEPWGATVLAGSEGAGPKQKNDHGIRSCYSRTAEGALYAIVNAAAYCTDSRYAVEGVEQTVAKGPGRDAAVVAARDANPCQPAADLIRGFRVASYDGSNATISLAVEISGQTAAVPYQLVWQDGDWKGILAENGSLPMAPGPLDSMANYTTWGHHAQ
jgi:hypothetical protein